MIKIKATNSLGESLVLSPDKYAIKKVSGLSPQGGTISTQKMARHGTEFINGTSDERNIVIDFKVLGDVEANRDALYSAFPVSLDVTLEIETRNKRVTITGYVEACEVDFFQMVAVGQISIICPDPFFYAQEAVFEAGEESISVHSSCPFESGYGVTVTFTEEAGSFTLANVTTGELLVIYRAFAVGDILHIDTEERTVTVNGANAYNNKRGEWALLRLGNNDITASHACQIEFADRYIGL